MIATPKVRFAKPSDKQDIMDFVSNTWPWGDYIPEVWDTWLNDEKGKTFVVETGGKVVGMNHIRMLDEGVGWLEGVRIHPEYRGRGLATLLGEEAMNYARMRGIRKFRLLSLADNKPAHRQIERMKFKEVTSHYGYKLRKVAARQIKIDQGEGKRLNIIQLAKKNLLESEEFKSGKGFFFDSWTMRSFNECGVEKVLKERCLLSKITETGSAFVLYSRSKGAEVFDQINFAWGDGKTIKELLVKLSGITKEPETRLPKTRSLDAAMRSAGFERKNESILYERTDV